MCPAETTLLFNSDMINGVEDLLFHLQFWVIFCTFSCVGVGLWRFVPKSLVWCYDVSTLLWEVPCHAQNRGDIGAVVYTQQGGC